MRSHSGPREAPPCVPRRHGMQAARVDSAAAILISYTYY
ncbi:hypothetical protein C7S13_6585 [Burkholderia cepacia]|nr:hypothetical protein [Burkholderia cepacia]